jgi:hypothetical protein
MGLLRRLGVASALAVAAAAPGCDVRPLRAVDLYGAAGGSAGASGGGASARGGAAGAGGLGGAGDQPGTDAAVDHSAPDGQGASDGSPSGCAQPCGPDQFCDELTNQCAPRIGTGMLSGIVVDACSRSGLDARIGIAGQRQCSAADKGSYFVSALPLGRLKLAAVKNGYELYSATVEIVAGGAIHDIELARAGGCQSTPPVSPCTCTEPSCSSTTP